MTTTLCLGPFQELVGFNFPPQKIEPVSISGYIDLVTWHYHDQYGNPYQAGTLVFVADAGLPDAWLDGKLPASCHGLRRAMIVGLHSHLEGTREVKTSMVATCQFTIMYPDPPFHDAGLIFMQYCSIGASGHPQNGLSPDDWWTYWDWANHEPATATFVQ